MSTFTEMFLKLGTANTHVSLQRG